MRAHTSSHGIKFSILIELALLHVIPFFPVPAMNSVASSSRLRPRQSLISMQRTFQAGFAVRDLRLTIGGTLTQSVFFQILREATGHRGASAGHPKSRSTL